MRRDASAGGIALDLRARRWLASLALAILLRRGPVPGVLSSLPAWGGGLLLGGATLLTGMATWRSGRSTMAGDSPNGVVGTQASRMPRIAAIGGGTGLSNLLRGLKRHPVDLTAIVTVTDDGGSSGRLRRDLRMIPPGDIRNCIVALAEAEPLLAELFQYRFDARHGAGISGHSFGNLFITALAEVTGSMETAVAETSRVLAVRGQIVPASLDDVTLSGRLRGGLIVHGESRIPSSGGPPEEVWIEPRDASAHRDAVLAIREADLIVIGPGSLYTSILPNLLIPGIAEALRAARGQKVFVVNVATQHGETDGYTAADHVAALHRHVGRDDLFDVVLANGNLPAEPLPAEWCSEPVVARVDADYGQARLVLGAVVDTDLRYRHDPDALAAAIMEAYGGRSAVVGRAGAMGGARRRGCSGGATGP